MNNEVGEQSIAKQRIIEDLIYEHARVARDVVQIDAQTWAIHGFIAVDGEVIMAEFKSRDDAEAAIEQLWAGEI
jgi:hypothetical protein